MTSADLFPPEIAEERLGGNLILEEDSDAAQQIMLVCLHDIYDVTPEDRTVPLCLCELQRSHVVHSHQPVNPLQDFECPRRDTEQLANVLAHLGWSLKDTGQRALTRHGVDHGGGQ
jgi:hypothetical protein